MRAVSVKRARQVRRYQLLRDAFLESRPWCESPLNCGRPATTVQHLRGRRGERLNDVEWWKASCLLCNLWAEDHTGEALDLGWLVRVEGVAS